MMKIFNRLNFSFLLFGLLLSFGMISQAKAALLVGSRGNNSVLRYDETTGKFIDTLIPSGSGGLNVTVGFAVGSDQNYYLSNFTGNSILRYDSNGNFLNTFVAPNSGGLDFPQVLAFGQDGNLYVSSVASIPNTNNTLNGNILRFNGKTGAFIDTFASAGIVNPAAPLSFAFGPDRNLYANNDVTGSILRYDGQTGALIGTFAQSQPGSIPGSLTFGPDGNLYVADFKSNDIARYNGKTGAFIDSFVKSGSGGLNGPTNPIFGSDGNLYVSSIFTNNVLRYNGQTGEFIDTFIPAGSGGLSQPRFLYFTKAVPEAANGLAVLIFGGVLFTRKLINDIIASNPRRSL